MPRGRAAPRAGEIGIFNRSHYEDVVAVRMLELAPKETWSRRPGHIVAFERILVDEGTAIVKVFLNISKTSSASACKSASTIPRGVGSSGMTTSGCARGSTSTSTRMTT